MKTNIVLYWALAGFFLLSAAIYTVWSLTDPSHGEVEWVGTPALICLALLFGFIAFYITKGYLNQGGELVEDRLDSSIDDGDPELGHFSPWSWWPITLGAAAALVFLGVAIGTWIFLIGVTVAVVALVGWTYEYYRGYFAS